jgi:hypothetical protein
MFQLIYALKKHLHEQVKKKILTIVWGIGTSSDTVASIIIREDRSEISLYCISGSLFHSSRLLVASINLSRGHFQSNLIWRALYKPHQPSLEKEL